MEVIGNRPYHLLCYQTVILVVPIMVVERPSVLEVSLRLVTQSLMILPYLGR